MDALGVHMKSGKRLHTKRSKKPIKVVYISSPMKVNTSASEFRALVQELTGKDSDATRFMDIDDGADQTHRQRAGHDHDHRVSAVPSANSSYQSPSTTSSELSFLESFDGELFPSFEESSFMGMLQSSLFHESFQLDVLD